MLLIDYVFYLLIIFTTSAVNAQTADGKVVYEQHCAQCHESGISRAPGRNVIAKLPPQAVLKSLESGSMQQIGRLVLSGSERVAVAEYITDKLLDTTQSNKNQQIAYCKQPINNHPVSLQKPHWNGWGNSPNNYRFQSAEMAQLAAKDIAKLKLKWAYGFKDEIIAQSQPTVISDRLYIGSRSGTVYAINAKSGCTYWNFIADAGVRTAITLGQINLNNNKRYMIYFGDLNGKVYALDADTGELLWKTRVEQHPLAQITGSPQLYNEKLYVPVSSGEEGAAGNPEYPCCNFRGSVVALDARNGKQIWKHYTISEPASMTDKNAIGTQQWGPSGAGVWTSPTIDVDNKTVYVGTGNNYSFPATETSDAILALDIANGKLRWSFQPTHNDVWTLACLGVDLKYCPENAGPDFDFGASPVLTKLNGSANILLAGQKSGILYAFDADTNGKLLWRVRAAKGGSLGGIQWGFAADSEKVYVAASDIEFAEYADLDKGQWQLLPDTSKGGGISAFRLTDGKRIWHVPPVKCDPGQSVCSPAQSAAVTVIPGVVFSGAVDGHMRAYSTIDGAVLWNFDTVRDYDTVNGVQARGGSIDGPGPVIVDGMVYINSGYGWGGGMAGNVLLAFAVK